MQVAFPVENVSVLVQLLIISFTCYRAMSHGKLNKRLITCGFALHANPIASPPACAALKSQCCKPTGRTCRGSECIEIDPASNWIHLLWCRSQTHSLSRTENLRHHEPLRTVAFLRWTEEKKYCAWIRSFCRLDTPTLSKIPVRC